VGKGDIDLFLGEIGKLRTSVFEGLNEVRKELGDKIDKSASERRVQIEDLKEHGCHQGKIDRLRLESIEVRLADCFTSGQVSSSSDDKKKVKIGFGKYKIDIGGFKASDVALILMTILIGWTMFNQQRILSKMDAQKNPYEHHSRTSNITNDKVDNG
jgi:hypothetical protein